MTKKILIDGMSCMHCVAHVKEALEELGAKNIEVSLEQNYAVADIDASNDELSAAIEDAGYDVVGIE